MAIKPLINKAFRLVLLLGMLNTAPVAVTAQIKRTYQVNDTLPDVVISNLIRKGDLPVKTRQLYKKGGLILNFWATWCAPCITEMGVLAEEVKNQKGRLEVINVSYESKTVVANFLRNHQELLNSGLHIVSDDKIWGDLFFHQGLPHNVWIDSRGVIRSITGGDEMKPENIRKFLAGQMPGMYQKVESPFNSREPMHIPDSLIEYRSIFNRRLPGVTMSGEVIDSHRWGIPNMKRYFVYNNIITHMIWSAYQLPGIWTFEGVNELMEIRTSDSTRYFWPGWVAKTGEYKKNYSGVSIDEWGRNNTYSYELRTPEFLPDSVFAAKVVSELEYNLHIRTWRELRKKQCMIVTSSTATEQLVKPAGPGQGSIKITGTRLVMVNITIDKILEYVHKHTYTKSGRPRIAPYLNKTNINRIFSATVDVGADPAKHISQAHLEKCLTEQLGLNFELREALFPVVVVQDL